MDTFDKINEAVNFIQNATNFSPKAGVVLGSGQVGFLDNVDIKHSIDYDTIPHFPTATAPSHHGRLVFGDIDGIPVVVMSGRFHFYEGYLMDEVVFPIRVLKFLGIEKLMIISACGSTRTGISTGDLVMVKDHINLQSHNPLTGVNDERLGVRFPDAALAYHKGMLEYAYEYGISKEMKVHKGVYVAVDGPNLETRAEFRFFNLIGADIVGMSTVPEVIAACHLSLDTFVLGVVSNEGYSEHNDLPKMTGEEIIKRASEATPKATEIIIALLHKFVS